MLSFREIYSEAHAKMGLRTYQRSAADMPLPSVHSDIKES